MSYVNGRIVDTGDNDGVSIWDVRQALGNVDGGGTAVTENTLMKLCQHPKINKWAKYKPMRTVNSIISPTDAERGIEDWEHDVWPHGLVYPYYADNIADCESEGEIAQNIIDGWSDAEEKSTYDGWNYLVPRGNYSVSVKEFFRVHDFRNNEHPTQTGYYHGADVPCKVYLKGFSYDDSESSFRYVTGTDNKKYLDINTAARSTLTFGIEFYAPSQGELSLKDIFRSSNYSDFRFFVTLFDGEVPNTDWYDSTNILEPYYEVPITLPEDTYTFAEVDVSVSGIVDATTIKRVHAVAGLITRMSSNDRYIILPQTVKNTTSTPSTVWDFYYPLMLSYHQSQYRTLNPLGVTLSISGTNTAAVHGSGTSWTLACHPANTTNNALFNFEVNKYNSGEESLDRLYFVAENGTAPSNGRPLYIKVQREGITSVSYWLEPYTSNWQRKTDPVEIEPGSSESFVSMYGMPPNSTGGQEGLFPAYSSGLSFTIRIFMYIGGKNVDPIENAVMNISYI